MSRSHSSEISLRCERTSNRIISGPPRFPSLSARSSTARRIAPGCHYDSPAGLRFRRGPNRMALGERGGVRPRSPSGGSGGSPACMDFKYAGAVKRNGDLALRIMIVGERILPFRHAGDKNFWLDMIRRLLVAGHEVEALSVDIEATPGNGLPIRHVPQIPVYFRPDARFNAEHAQFGGVNNYVSKTTNVPIIFREVRRRQRTFRPDVIHFADNFGPATVVLRAISRKVPLTLSAPTYHRNRPLYDVMLLASFSSFAMVVPFSEAYRRRLLELGFPSERIRRIRWGIDTARFSPPTDDKRAAARASLGLERGKFVVLWTGFTQQTNETDLQEAIRIATLTLERRPLAFIFCFKPENFRPTFRNFDRPGTRVVETSEVFRSACTAADVFLCPIQDPRSIAAPPLVWPELLAMGIPILTTDTPGTDEAVVDGESGLPARSSDEARGRLLEIEADSALQRRLRDGARKIAVERFSVDRAMDEYVDMWSALVAQSR